MSLAQDIQQAGRFAMRDLRGSKAGLRLLAICLFLGVAALAGIGSLSSAILGGLAERGQSILGGDMQFEVSQRAATPAELAAMAKIGTVSQTIRMSAMGTRGDGSGAVLAEFKGVDGAYPFYGKLELAPGALAVRPHDQDVAIAPALAEKLHVNIGDTLRIGDAKLRIIGIISQEPDRTSEGFTLGPVVLADMVGVARANIVQPGSLYTMRYRIKTSARTDLASAKTQFVAAFPNGGWTVTDRTNGAPGTRRFIERLGQFLGLVGLTSLVIAGIGVGNGVGSWLDDKRGAIATFKILGASGRTIFLLYALQILIVTLVAIVFGVALGALFPWLIVTFAGDKLPVVPNLSVYPLPLGLAAAYGLLIAALFSLAPLARARAVTPANLFRNKVERGAMLGWRTNVAIALTGSAIAALAIFTAHEPGFATIFIAAILILLALLAVLGRGISTLARHLPRPKTPLVRLALGNLHRPGAQTGRLVVALGLGLTLFATLGVIQTSLAAQIANTIPKRAPLFFALDIPKDDEARFRNSILSITPKAEIVTVPMLRGPIVAIGTTRVADMKTIPEDAWFLRGDRGLTFARDLPQGSRITAGNWWPPNYAGPPLVSLDERAAKLVGLKVGDTLTISVLGVEIKAKIASLRQINWDTMGFNFVLVFSPGSLDAAPYTLAATIAAPAPTEAAISQTVSAGFPAVSMARVKDVITQVGTLLGQLGSAISIAASVAVVAGIAVLIGAIAAAQRAGRYDAVLLKVLGATRRQIMLVQAIEYGALAIIVSLLALAIGSAAGWYVVTQVFELEWSSDWKAVVLIVGTGGLGTWAIGLLGTLPVLNARPADALRSL